MWATAAMRPRSPVPPRAAPRSFRRWRPERHRRDWSPVVITVPTGQDLQINLTNNLSFGPNNIPTSLVIVGQLGGGLGHTATTTSSPDHTAASPHLANRRRRAGRPADRSRNPPVQGPRVQSFSTEVVVGTHRACALGFARYRYYATGPALKPGTYLIESGTHPSSRVRWVCTASWW